MKSCNSPQHDFQLEKGENTLLVVLVAISHTNRPSFVHNRNLFFILNVFNFFS